MLEDLTIQLIFTVGAQIQIHHPVADLGGQYK